MNTIRRFFQQFFPFVAPIVVAGMVIGVVDLIHLKAADSQKDLLVAGPSIYVCTGNKGETISAEFEVRNASSEAVKLLGATTSCSCTTVADEFPIQLPASGVTKIHVHVVVGTPDPEGHYVKTLQLYVNKSGKVPLLTVDIHVSKS